MEPNNSENIRNPDGTFKVGNPGSPGRPKGKSLKEFWKQKLADMSDEDKEKWTSEKGIAAELIWRMGEGNPANATDLTTQGEKLMIMPAELITKNDPDSKSEPNS